MKTLIQKISVVGMIALDLSLTACTAQAVPPSVVTVTPPVKVVPYLVVPVQSLEPCFPLSRPRKGDARSILNTMIENQEIYGECLNKDRLKTDFIKAASRTGARIKLYGSEDSPGS